MIYKKYKKRIILNTINTFLRFHTKVRYMTLFFLYFMPIGVPKVSFRTPGDGDASWVDI